MSLKTPWKHCIITYIDQIGTKTVRDGEKSPSRRMRELHRLVDLVAPGMETLAQAYCWNDSALLLAYWNKEQSQARHILREVSELIRQIEKKVGRNFAGTVKGQVFPKGKGQQPNRKCVVLETSSYAMANCFAIEAAGKKLSSPPKWYVDSRLKDVLSPGPYRSFKVTMLPKNKPRRILRMNRKMVRARVSLGSSIVRRVSMIFPGAREFDHFPP